MSASRRSRVWAWLRDIDNMLPLVIILFTVLAVLMVLPIIIGLWSVLL